MKINKEGYGMIGKAITLALSIITLVCLAQVYLDFSIWIVGVVGFLSLGTVVFLLSFFREPKRPILQDDGVVFSPADGKVVVIEDVEESEFLKCKCMQISVYMSPSNVHINWYPVGGKIVYQKHNEGAFMLAWSPKSSEKNEHTSVAIDTGKNVIMYRQIAGWAARRIVSYAKVGDIVKQNQKSGCIKLGSRLDVFVPMGSEILVSLGQKVVGSQTPLVRLK